MEDKCWSSRSSVTPKESKAVGLNKVQQRLLGMTQRKTPTNQLKQHWHFYCRIKPAGFALSQARRASLKPTFVLIYRFQEFVEWVANVYHDGPVLLIRPKCLPFSTRLQMDDTTLLDYNERSTSPHFLGVLSRMWFMMKLLNQRIRLITESHALAIHDSLIPLEPGPIDLHRLAPRLRTELYGLEILVLISKVLG